MERIRQICTDCGSDDIISPRRCSLEHSLKTYCPKCDVVVESNEFYICHSTEIGHKDFSVYICPGCKSHMSSIPVTKEESMAMNEIADKIIDEILMKELRRLDS